MRLSRRLPESMEENDLSRALAQRRAAGSTLLDLTASNPSACGLGPDPEGFREALADPRLWTYTPDSRGLKSTREVVARYHGHAVDPDQVILAASTSEAYGWLFKLLGDPGAEVLVPTPSYPLFTWLARLEGMAALPVPAFWHDRWHLDLDAMAAAVNERTVAVVVVNPNNPTGQFLTQDEWKGLTKLCAGSGLVLIVDEVFSDYALEPPSDAIGTVLSDPEPACPVFVLSGLSKIAALPQLKLGWILAHGAKARAYLPALTFLADQYLSVSAAAQVLGATALESRTAVQDSLVARLRQNLAILDGALQGSPHLSRLVVEGGWSVVLRRPAMDDAEACAERLVRDHAVLIHPGTFFDLPGDGYLVISLLPEASTFEAGVQALLEGLTLPTSGVRSPGLPPFP